MRIVCGRIPGRRHQYGAELAGGVGGGAGEGEPAGEGDACGEDPAGEDPAGEADAAGDGDVGPDGDTTGDSEAAGGLPLPGGPVAGGLLALTGRLGLAVGPGEALPLASAVGDTSWTSIRKSKEGIVEAQSGETEISAVP